MSAEGFFHDAHEVYYTPPGGERLWIGTFRSKWLAELFVAQWPTAKQVEDDSQHPAEMFEVVPV